MDRLAAYIIDAGLIFFVTGSLFLLALSALTFGPDLARATKRDKLSE